MTSVPESQRLVPATYQPRSLWRGHTNTRLAVTRELSRYALLRTWRGNLLQSVRAGAQASRVPKIKLLTL
jgi:hypothetical protein